MRGLDRVMISLCAGSFVAMGEATAREVYKWVDSGGVTYYSEEPPVARQTARGVETLRLVPDSQSQNTGSVRVNYQSIMAQASQMQENRLARERLRLEREKLRLQEQSNLAALGRINSIGTTTYYPAYFGQYPRYRGPYAYRSRHLHRQGRHHFGHHPFGQQHFSRHHFSKHHSHKHAFHHGHTSRHHGRVHGVHGGRGYGGHKSGRFIRLR